MSQSPSKPGHYSNRSGLEIRFLRQSQSPSKPGHYSNESRTVNITFSESQSPSKPGHYSNPVDWRPWSGWSVAIPFKTGSLFKFMEKKTNFLQLSQSPSKPGHYSNMIKKLTLTISEKSQSPSKPGHYSNTLSLWNKVWRWLSQSPSKPGHYSNIAAQINASPPYCRNPLQNRVTIQIATDQSGTATIVAIPFKTGSLFKWY